jgi:hypothetical protein
LEKAGRALLGLEDVVLGIGISGLWGVVKGGLGLWKRRTKEERKDENLTQSRKGAKIRQTIVVSE